LQPIVKYVDASCSQRTDLVTQRDPVKGVYTVFPIPATMDDYYASLSKNERKNRRKYELRLLKKEFDTQVHVETDAAKVSDEFERFAVQHAGQWAAEGKTGHFGAWPRALDYNRALVKTQSAAGRLRFIRIIVNGQVIANQYTFAFGDRYYWELPSREADQKWERFSLGPTGIVTMIERAMKEGIKAIEGGLAHYDYKLRLGATEHNVFTFRILSARPAARARFALFSFVRACWSYAYHKIWYRRIMPRVPRAFWRPQPNQWLRLDF
jgi:CelD/BcsL family acetyltransferase involved in cellulose biosynthesis